MTRHEMLARQWAAYNSRSGRATPKQTALVMKQLTEDDLARMLAARGVKVVAPW